MHDTINRPCLLEEFMENCGVSLPSFTSRALGRFASGNAGTLRVWDEMCSTGFQPVFFAQRHGLEARATEKVHTLSG
jgi:hypothetical protein